MVINSKEEHVTMKVLWDEEGQKSKNMKDENKKDLEASGLTPHQRRFPFLSYRVFQKEIIYNFHWIKTLENQFI